MAMSPDQDVSYNQNMSDEQQPRRLEHVPSHPLEFGDSDAEVCRLIRNINRRWITAHCKLLPRL